jgi:hypothetical protein
MKRYGLLLSLVVLLAAGAVWFGFQTWQVYQRGARLPSTSEIAFDELELTPVPLRPVAFVPEKVDLDQVLDRAVFEPTRRRPLPEQVSVPEPQPEPEPVVQQPEKSSSLDIAILGIVLQDDTGFLIVKSEGDGRPQQITLGDRIEGWTLVQLSELVAVFERDGEETRLNLGLE